MDIDDPVYRDSNGVDWWWDGKVWSYWENDSDEWVIAPEASPLSLFEVEDDMPIGARPTPPGYVRGTDGRLYPR